MGNQPPIDMITSTIIFSLKHQEQLLSPAPAKESHPVNDVW
jgi:hypothetical protein